MSNVLVPQVGFAGTTTTHLLSGRWSEDHVNYTACGLRANTVGYYQLGMSEVHCVKCLAIHAKGAK